MKAIVMHFAQRGENDLQKGFTLHQCWNGNEKIKQLNGLRFTINLLKYKST